MSSAFHNKKSTTSSSSSTRGSVMKSALGMQSPRTRLSSFPHSQGKSSNGQGILNQIYVNSSSENMDYYQEHSETAKSFNGFNVTQSSASKHGFRSMSKSNSNLSNHTTNNLNDCSSLSNRNKIKAPTIPFVSYSNSIEQSKINNEHKSTLMSVVNDQPFSLFSSSQNSKTEALMFTNKVNSSLLEHTKNPVIIEPIKESSEKHLKFDDILTSNVVVPMYETNKKVDGNYNEYQQQQPKISLSDVLSDKTKLLSIFNSSESVEPILQQQHQQNQHQQLLSSLPPPQQQQQPKISLADVLSDKTKPLSIFNSSESSEQQQISSTTTSNRNLNSILKSKPTPIYSSSIPLESQPTIPTQININDSSAISLFSFRKNENSLIQLKTNSNTLDNEEKHISKIESFDKLFINGDLLKSPQTPSDNSITPSSGSSITRTPNMLRFPFNPKSSSASLPPGYPQPVHLTPEMRKDLGDDDGFF